MQQRAFAALCGISQPMVSKYASDGVLVMTALGEIDPLASLVALEGRLNETKRRSALQTFGGASTPQPAGAGGSQPVGAKAQKDALDVQLKRLQLAREAGQVVEAAHVEDAAMAAIGALREAFGNRRREAAERLCAAFDLAPEKATSLARMLGEEFEAALGIFSEAIDRCAEAEGVARKPTPLAA